MFHNIISLLSITRNFILLCMEFKHKKTGMLISSRTNGNIAFHIEMSYTSATQSRQMHLAILTCPGKQHSTTTCNSSIRIVCSIHNISLLSQPYCSNPTSSYYTHLPTMSIGKLVILFIFSFLFNYILRISFCQLFKYKRADE